jgi:hypothetical protein
MEFPQDGGLSCVRSFLLPARDDSLETLACAALTGARSRVAGRLLCQCGGVDLWGVRSSPEVLRACCGCNGSTLPVYLGAPPSPRGDLADWRCPACTQQPMAVTIAVGYPQESLPALGTLDAERAVGVAVALRCVSCGHEALGWSRILHEPPAIRGDEPWLDRIQGLRRPR